MMKILNLTQGFTVSEDAQMRNTAEGRRKGLMGSDKKDIIIQASLENRVFATIHMFKMNYPIDVIWCDKNLKVVEVRREIPISKLSKPKTWLHMPKQKAKYIIELGKNKDTKTKKQDQIRFE